jgi:hypothetical protein
MRGNKFFAILIVEEYASLRTHQLITSKLAASRWICASAGDDGQGRKVWHIPRRCSVKQQPNSVSGIAGIVVVQPLTEPEGLLMRPFTTYDACCRRWHCFVSGEIGLRYI